MYMINSCTAYYFIYILFRFQKNKNFIFDPSHSPLTKSGVKLSDGLFSALKFMAGCWVLPFDVIESIFYAYIEIQPALEKR
jgi:hypothetical protein